MLPDFFLDEYDDHVGGLDAKKPAAAAADQSGSGKIPALFDRIGKHLSAELVSQANAVYQFNVSGVETFTLSVAFRRQWHTCRACRRRRRRF